VAKWTLYWVEVSRSPSESCFVVARNSRSAAAIERSASGFDPGDVEATRVMPVTDQVEQAAVERHVDWLATLSEDNRKMLSRLTLFGLFAKFSGTAIMPLR